MTEPDPLVEQWLEYLLLDRNRSPRTIIVYRSTMRAVDHPSTATREELEAWWLTTRGMSPATRASKLSTFRSFYTWCRKWEHRLDDPTIRIDAPDVGKGAPHPLTKDEVATLLAHSSPEVRRAVALCAFAGLRVSEAAALDWSTIDRDTQRITVRGGKGNKDRSIALPPRLLDELGMVRRKGNVIRPEGKPYTPNALAMAINKTMKDLGIENTSHGLRGRYATMALTSVNLLSVARALGHSSTDVTSRYAATSDSDLDLIGEAVTRGL